MEKSSEPKAPAKCSVAVSRAWSELPPLRFDRAQSSKGKMSSLLLSDLNACSRDEFVAALGNVFEYSPWIAEQATLARPFDGVQQLFDAMKAVVDQTAPELRLALIRGHPDLANKTQRAAGLTAESSAEQSGAGLDRLSDAEFEAFERVNSAYRTKFGFPSLSFSRRFLTTSSAACFWQTTSSDLPIPIASATILTIVWLLPVPGGPSIT